MKVLVIGEGGREHAICWKLAQSSKVKKIYCAPGNAGIAEIANQLAISSDNHTKIIETCKKLRIDLVVIGPEGPLVAGLADQLQHNGIKTFGPKAAAAAIEGSKIFMKELLQEYKIPTAAFRRFHNPDAAKKYIAAHGAPLVVKADGLAGGKGVLVCHTERDAHIAIEQIMIQSTFGNAGNEIIIENLLIGEEISFFALVDGHDAVPMASAQDHKTVLEGDKGLNTGGMGAYSPALIADQGMVERIMNDIIKPVARALVLKKRAYQGVLFAGLMVEKDGPKVIEFNCRFGDPECQVLMSRLKTDVVDVFLATIESRLHSLRLEWDERAALTVIMASKGYPGTYKKNTIIKGLTSAKALNDLNIFHSGTRIDGDGQLYASGGRVLGITGTGATIKEAQVKAYQGVDEIDWPNGFCRRDIGWRAT